MRLLPFVVLCIFGAVDFGVSADFSSDVQPILKRHCDRCHGNKVQESDLNLFSATMLKDAAGNLDQSTLLARISDPEQGDVMPLDGQPLTKREIATIREWIAEGAEIPSDALAKTHWAYTKPVSTQPPSGEASSQYDHPIDRFIAERLASKSLSLSPPADAATTARRVSLALTGLPATLEQIDRLESDFTPKRYGELVDQLLASPAFGQHWARHWLDLASYADSNGFQADQLRDSWAYRDWVVRSFNENLPFNDFVVRQIAGDLLPNATSDDRVATGFFRTPTCNVEAGVDPESNRVKQVFDRVNTLGTVFLGTTLECAQCHDHKYDPFTQEDYYRLFAFFNNTPLEVKNTSGVTYDFVGPKMDLPLSADQQAELDKLTLEKQNLNESLQQAAGDKEFRKWLTVTKSALSNGRAKWVTPAFEFSTTGNETFEILEDKSVLLSGATEPKTVYHFQYKSLEGPILGVRIDALRHDDLPGKGPGRGDEKRTNFVLHELEIDIEEDGWQSIQLGGAEASFSQKKFDVGQAVDGNLSTAWAISPKFTEEHCATFRTLDPLRTEADQAVRVTLDQRYGSGRVIGRPKISFLIGPPGTEDLTDELAALIQKSEPLKKAERSKLVKYFRSANPGSAAIQRKIEKVNQRIKKIQPLTTLVMVERDEMRETHIMQRGDYLSPGSSVTAGTPGSLHRLAEGQPPNRLTLANWVVDPANPLLARVTVNRFWSEIFGRGIVATPEDFGTQSEFPSHPKLLDHLAMEFQNSNWSVKSLLKSIVMSNTFRQQSFVAADRMAADPDNSFLSRGPRFRLSAEAIRDNALHVAGLLSVKTGGPPIMPYQPSGIWRAVGRNQPTWKAADDADRFRRGLYVVWKRGAPYPSFVTFDAPDRSSCTAQRARTNTPLQALVLLNDRAYAEAAVGLAQRVLSESESKDPREIARLAHRLATGKRPSEKTVNLLVTLYNEQVDQISLNPKLANQRIGVLPIAFRDQSYAPKDVAAWYVVANVLLNLDQTITLN